MSYSNFNLSNNSNNNDDELQSTSKFNNPNTENNFINNKTNLAVIPEKSENFNEKSSPERNFDFNSQKNYNVFDKNQSLKNENLIENYFQYNNNSKNNSNLNDNTPTHSKLDQSKISDENNSVFAASNYKSNENPFKNNQSQKNKKESMNINNSQNQEDLNEKVKYVDNAEKSNNYKENMNNNILNFIDSSKAQTIPSKNINLRNSKTLNENIHLNEDYKYQSKVLNNKDRNFLSGFENNNIKEQKTQKIFLRGTKKNKSIINKINSDNKILKSNVKFVKSDLNIEKNSTQPLLKIDDGKGVTKCFLVDNDLLVDEKKGSKRFGSIKINKSQQEMAIRLHKGLGTQIKTRKEKQAANIIGGLFFGNKDEANIALNKLKLISNSREKKKIFTTF